MGIRCCYGCVPPKRHRACWDTCPDYIQEKAEDDKKKQVERDRRAADRAFREQRRQRYRKINKKHR